MSTAATLPAMSHHIDIAEHATLPPKVSTTVSLGLFEKSVPEPQFDITYSPRDTYGNVRSMIVRVPEGSEYRLLCVFQNFTTQPYTATIKEKLS